MRECILDRNIPTNYKRDQTSPSDQRKMYQEWSAFAKDQQYARQSVVGSAPYLNDIAATVRQVRTALAPSTAGNFCAGWVGYSYRTPDAMTDAGTRTGAASRAELERALTQVSTYDPVTPPVFASTTNVPPMTWKTQPTTGHLRGIARSSDGTVLAQTQVLLFSVASGAIVRSIKTDGNGWFAFVDLPSNNYRVDASGETLGLADVITGRLTTLGQGTTPVPTPTPTPTATPLGGDGQLGSPATGWPRYNRIALQPAEYVGPGQVAWFQFTIQAPTAPGTYRLYLRPLIEGAQWMEDYGVFWVVTVKS